MYTRHRKIERGTFLIGVFDAGRWQDRFSRFFAVERPSSIALGLISLLALVVTRGAWGILRLRAGTPLGEADNVAAALALGRGFSDAFRVGQGPTAHVLPLNPMLAAAAYSVFGVRTPAAEFVLTFWSIAITAATYVTLLHVFRRLGVSERARILAFAFLCFVPPFISQEAVDFRVWEGGVAAWLMNLCLLIILKGAEGRWTVRAAASSMVILALLFFINPLAGLAAYASAATLAFRKLSPKQFLAAGALAIIPLAALLVPWTLRNQAQLHAPVILRSNAGLELALATNPAMLDPARRRSAYFASLKIHPAVAYDRMQAAGGEVAYSAALGREALRWIVSHPGLEAKLLLIHLREIYAPQPWMWQLFSNPVLSEARALCVTIVNLLGMLGLLWALFKRRHNWLYPTVMVFIFTLGLLPFQPIPRYIYIIYPLLTFGAAYAVCELASWYFLTRRPLGLARVRLGV